MCKQLHIIYMGVNILDLEFLKEKQTTNVLFTLLSVVNDDPKYAVLSDLSVILDEKCFLNVLKLFEGTTIKIPPREETERLFRMLLLYQYYEVEKYTWAVSAEKAGFGKMGRNQSAMLRVQYAKYVNTMKSKNFKVSRNLHD